MNTKKIRYAVVGLGHISQVAILPAFKNAKNSELVALVSGDEEKMKQLGKQYNVPNTYHYDQYEECLASGQVDAVFIALPNEQHREYSVKAANAKVHVLCEKPMAVSSQDCRSMIDAASNNQVKLMIAYRLHFEEANLEAIEIANSGKLGDVRIFNSVFTIPIKDEGIRLNPRSLGGGPVYDIGIYCINAARYIFQDEPIEVTARAFSSQKKPFENIEESMSVIMRLSQDRVASFTCGFDCASVGTFRIAGTKGDLRMENAYEYKGAKKQFLTIENQLKVKEFEPRDHFAAELKYFSDCIINDKTPEPSGEEGLADIQIIEGIFKSADEGRPVRLEIAPKPARPNMSQEIKYPPVEEPELVNTAGPTGETAA